MATTKESVKGAKLNNLADPSKTKIPSIPIVNPVLVTVGQEVLPHQTPVYAWQLDGDDGKLMMKNDQMELKINYSGENTKLLQSMYDYTIVPSEKIKQRMDYFYTPYNQKFLLRKHMTFEDQAQEVAAAEEAKGLAPSEPIMNASCLADMLKNANAESEADPAAAQAAEAPKQSETEDQGKVPLRDRVFTKAEIAQLEKKSWIEVKDLIFETDRNILDYLNFHCKRWRKTEQNRLVDEESSQKMSIKNSRCKGVAMRNNSQAANSSFASSSPKKTGVSPVQKISTLQVSQLPGSMAGISSGCSPQRRKDAMMNLSAVESQGEITSAKASAKNSFMKSATEEEFPFEQMIRNTGQKLPEQEQNGSSQRASSREKKRRSEPIKVILPEKGSCKSQYVIKDRQMKEQAERLKKQEQQKKKFVNLGLCNKRFNGVIVGSDQVLSDKRTPPCQVLDTSMQKLQRLNQTLVTTVESNSNQSRAFQVHQPRTAKTQKAKAIKIIEDHEQMHRMSQTRTGMRQNDGEMVFGIAAREQTQMAQTMRPATVQWPQKDFESEVSNDQSLNGAPFNAALCVDTGGHMTSPGILKQHQYFSNTRDSCMTDPEAHAVLPPTSVGFVSPGKIRPDERGSSQFQGFTQNRLKRLEELANRSKPLTAIGGLRSVSKSTNKVSDGRLTSLPCGAKTVTSPIQKEQCQPPMTQKYTGGAKHGSGTVYATIFAKSMSSQAPTMPSGSVRQREYRKMMNGMRATSFPSSSHRMTAQNLSLLNESYATAVTMSQANRTQNFSEIGVAHNSFTQNHTPIEDALHEIDNKIKNYPGSHLLAPTSPSRFKLGMYKLNQVLDPPRAKPSKELAIRRVMSTDKKPRRLIDQFILDYATVRPGPTAQLVADKLLLQSPQKKSVDTSTNGGQAGETCENQVFYMPFMNRSQKSVNGPGAKQHPMNSDSAAMLKNSSSAEQTLNRYTPAAAATTAKA